MDTNSTEELKEQSNIIKLKLNREVEGVFDSFMRVSREEPKDSKDSNLKMAKLKGLMTRMEWLKKTKESICD